MCVAVYSLADSVNVTFSFALRGAGDTRFVSLLTFVLAWPIMVVPTYRGRPQRRQHLLGLGVRDGVHRRDGRLLLLAVPDRQVEDHARDRGRAACAGTGITIVADSKSPRDSAARDFRSLPRLRKSGLHGRLHLEGADVHRAIVNAQSGRAGGFRRP